MEISKDKIVVIEYTLRLADGSYVRGEAGRPVSMNFAAGYAQILPSLETRLTGLRASDECEFVIPAAEAFGLHDEKEVHFRSFEDHPEGREFIPGKWVVAKNEETLAQYGFFVKEKTEEGVFLDFNHPLAGKDLHYRVKVIHVREATPEELEALRPCEHGKNAEE
jgi:FKBP-type peptidyl-prolyl cis-trans isomerase SlyD